MATIGEEQEEIIVIPESEPITIPQETPAPAQTPEPVKEPVPA